MYDYETINEHLAYDPETGRLWWLRSTCNRIPDGQDAGYIAKDGYLRTNFMGKKFANHRIAWLLHYGDWPQKEIDHINRIKTDNRIENLRDASRSENAKNMRHRYAGEQRHGGKGVTNHKSGKWQVQVHCPAKGRPVYGGIFTSLADAEAKASEMRAEFDL